MVGTFTQIFYLNRLSNFGFHRLIKATSLFLTAFTDIL